MHVALPDLLSANNLTTKSLILPGDKLPTSPVGAAAPANAQRVVPVAGSLVYTVKSGDFLVGIATSYKVTLADLLAVNQITIQSLILPEEPGAAQQCPGSAGCSRRRAGTTNPVATTPAAGAVTYTVKFGDFLAGIAAQFKVKLSDLLAVNKITASSLILPGAKLAMPANAVEPVAPPAQVESTAGPAGVVVAYAYAQLGKPYRFFTAGPNTFDCSGLVKAAYAQIGIEMIHHAASQATLGTAVDIWSEPIKAGDLIFMATQGDHTAINHVGIAVDATHWIHAPVRATSCAWIPPKGPGHCTAL